MKFAAAQSPDSTATRTVSFEGSSSRKSRSDTLMSKFLSAASRMQHRGGSRIAHFARHRAASELDKVRPGSEGSPNAEFGLQLAQDHAPPRRSSA
jgi:hypothetical protein